MIWTERDIAKLRELAFAEKGNLEISAELGVSVAEIYAKRSSLGITMAKVRAAKSGVETKQKESPKLIARGQNKESHLFTDQMLDELKEILYQESQKAITEGLRAFSSLHDKA